MLSSSRWRACHHPSRGIPAHEIVNPLNDQGIATEYADLLSAFARSGIMERERLQRNLLVPGMTEFNHVILDRFEFSEFKIVSRRR
jgi:hypothetical protein